MIYNKYKIIKIIQDYPLSKVEIVQYKNKKYIIKSVPKFYDIQIKRQNYIVKKCKKSLIPKIHWVKEESERKYFLMNYIMNDKKNIKEKEYIETINNFHLKLKKNDIITLYDNKQKYK